MLKITLEYIPLDPNVSFLMIKQTEVTERPEYLYFFTPMFILAFLCFFLDFWPFSERFRMEKFSPEYREALYYSDSDFRGSVRVYMGIFANGGLFSKISFVILGFLWWFSTFKAYQLARQKKFKEHKQWMWRSFAFTLSAITLRMWKVIIVYLFHPNPMDVYQIIAWLGWIPNILLIEYLITKKQI
jgi:hypothetical protein